MCHDISDRADSGLEGARALCRIKRKRGNEEFEGLIQDRAARDARGHDRVHGVVAALSRIVE